LSNTSTEKCEILDSINEIFEISEITEIRNSIIRHLSFILLNFAVEKLFFTSKIKEGYD